MRRHNRLLHGWGVTCGLQVKLPQAADSSSALAPNSNAANPAGQTSGSQVIVCPGFAVGPQGDDILVECPVTFDVATGAQTPDPCAVAWPCPPTGQMPSAAPGQSLTVYLAIRFAECQTRPVRLAPAGCGCDPTACEYSRVRESFELKTLFQVPASHTAAATADTALATDLAAWIKERDREFPFPAPPCPPCTDDPWVVIATVIVQTPTTRGTGMQIRSVTANHRRVLLSTQALQALTPL